MKAASVIFVAVCLRTILLFYGEWQDRHFDVKYTDIDYQVFSDAASFVVHGQSPYDRTTYRYSPLIAWLLVPNTVLTPLWGKVVFCAFDIMAGGLMLLSKATRGSFSPSVSVALWLLNPFTVSISTRGSCDSVTVFSLLLMFLLLEWRQHCLAGFVWGLAIHWRLFPVIYAPSILLNLVYQIRRRRSAPSQVGAPQTNPCLGDTPLSDMQVTWKYLFEIAVSVEAVSFGLGTLTSLVTLGGIFYNMYPEEYLQHALLYHASRLDPRHNFAVHFYLTYLAHWSSRTAFPVELPVAFLGEMPLTSVWDQLGQLLSFLQGVLILAAALAFRSDLLLSLTLTTIIFVAFNKVSTAQYFVWYFGFLSLVASQYPADRVSKIGSALVVWTLAQGNWLLWAYLLEFQGWSCFPVVWLSSCAFLLAHIPLIRSVCRLRS